MEVFAGFAEHADYNAGRVIDDNGFAPHGAKRAYGAVYAANEHVGRASEYFLGVWPLHFNRFG